MTAGNTSSYSLVDLYNRSGQLWRLMWRNWWVIGLVGLCSGVAGVGYAWWQQARYESRLTFALYEGGGGLGDALSLASELGLNISGVTKQAFEGENILQIFTSRRIIERVLLQPDTLNGRIQTMAGYYQSLGKQPSKASSPKISFPVGLTRSQFSYQQDSLLFRMYETIVKGQLSAVKPDRKLNLYEIKFVSEDERFTKVFSDKLLQEVVAFYTEIRTARSKRTLDILEQRVAQMKGKAIGAINAQTSVKDANLNPAFSNAQAPVQRFQMDVATYGTAYTQLMTNLELARYQYLQDTPLLQVIDDIAYPMKKIKMGRLLTGLLFGMAGTVLAVVIIWLRALYRKLRHDVAAAESSNQPMPYA